MRLIDADALMEDINDSISKMTEIGIDIDLEWLWAKLHDALEDAPTIEERKTGKWILDDKSGRYRCSECISVASRDDHGNEVLSDYCGVCGARMEKA